MSKYQKYIQIALNLGALDVIEFNAGDICYDERTLLKCAFGCNDYGLNHTCPSASNFLGIDMYKRIFSKYKGGVVIHCGDKYVSQKASFAIESQAFVDGYYWAFSLSDCSICETCAAKDSKPCNHKRMARPAFHSVGIDVFKTVRGLGLPLQTLSDENQPQNWYSAVFID